MAWGYDVVLWYIRVQYEAIYEYMNSDEVKNEGNERGFEQGKFCEGR